ncbi:outer membrane beta-barrel family protein [uncultured Algibacter sp.]|uniref:outer membrane beta-barrel family protein n=1 Tax=uncultured Algibacter sp. TaxID=298659 RepID=UPI00263756ED|nr:outer membrane beta-barrel family protein [uncultured Algibacter sp.]
MKRLILFVFTLSFSFHVFAQNTYSISGLVNDSNNQGVPYVNILLLKATDSTLAKGTISKENGTYIIENASKGNYLIMCSSVGYQTVYSKPFALSKNYITETLFLNEGEQLDEVLVEATKPLYQQKVDRMVINVESSIVSAGGTALEVLESSPGVNVDRGNGSISLVGKDGVVVMINGKTSYVPTSALVQLLDGLSANNIESIELITTPPANFDAEGNAGFINIVMKEKTDIGLNGAYSLSAGLGNGEITSNNINFNYRNNKINLYGNYSYSLRTTKHLFQFNNEYPDNNAIINTAIISDRDPERIVHNYRFGLDYQVSDKTIVGVLLNGYDNKWSMDAITSSNTTESTTPISSVELILDELNQWKHYGVNLNLKHDFQPEKFIVLNLDYLYYKDNNPIKYNNTFYDENDILINNELLRTEKITPIKTIVGKFDYNNKIDEKLKLETGLKATNATFDNNVSLEEFINNAWTFDPAFTNKSNLKESILASYFALDYTINKKWSSKIGLRYEYTDSQLETNTQGKVVDRKYGLWFPSLFFQRKFTDDFNMNLSYTKRITRPTFDEQAPFQILWDPTTITIGNAALQPGISNSVKYDINYKSYIMSFQYTDEESSIARFQRSFDEDLDLFILRSENLDYTKTFSATLGFPLKISSWWRMQNSFIYINQKTKATFTNVPSKLSQGYLRMNTNSSFKISDTFSGEITTLYIGPSISGTAKSKEIYRVNLGVQKKIGDNGSLKFALNDVFNTYEIRRSTDLPEENIKFESNFKFLYRSYMLSYTHNFGNSKLKSARKRETGSEEERRRVN